jgi:hypothetical protein
MVHIKPLRILATVSIFLIAQAASAVGLDNVPTAHFNPHHELYPEVGTIGDMFTQGNEDLWLRLRYEDVEEDRDPPDPLAAADDADLLSFRTQFGFTTARLHGFYLRAELEAAINFGDNALNLDDDFTFPPGPAGSRLAEGHAIIPDNTFGEANELYVGWRSGSGACPNSPGFCDGNTSFKLGRQTIIYDNHRWVGDIVWRNNHQSYNAARIDNSSIKNLELSYAYVDKVNRTFGPESVFEEFKLNHGHLINVAYTFPQFGKLTGYGYLLDFDDNTRTPPFVEGTGIPAALPNIYDSETWGARFVGRHELGDSLDLLTEFEWANQDPSDDASNTFKDNDYYNLELGIRFGGTRVDNIGFLPVGEPTYEILVGRETLEGNGINAVQTPLATIHAFNGWADVFIGAPAGTATPVGGLVDTSVTFQVLGLLGDYIGKNKIVVAYHDYEADDDNGGPDDYGEEWNLLWGKPDLFGQENLLGAIKYADYDADEFGVDTKKIWAFLEFRYK